MMKKYIRIFLMMIAGLFFRMEVLAQCAMCRASMENSISESSDSFSASLNTGILYLFVTPYLLILLIAYMWFRSSRKNGKNYGIKIRSGRKVS